MYNYITRCSLMTVDPSFYVTLVLVAVGRILSHISFHSFVFKFATKCGFNVDLH